MKRLVAIAVVVAFAASSAMAQSASQRRGKAPPRAAQDPTLKFLNQPMHDFSVTEVPFEQVMESIVDITKANFQVRWQKLEDNGVAKDKPISIKVSNVPLSMVLWMIMNEAGGTDTKLAYRASSTANGVLVILSTADDLGEEMVVRVYDVTDLLVNVPRFDNAPRIDPSQALQGASQTGGSGGSGGSSVFSDTGQEDEQENQTPGAAAPGMEELIRIIVDTVEPDTWVQNGGKGTITPFRYQIIIRNNILVHQKLNGYKLREE